MTVAVRVILLFAAVSLLLITSGCAHYRKELDTNPAFASHRFRYYDVEMNWQAQKGDNGILLTGDVKNLRDYYLHDLEITARFLDSEGRVLTRETFADFPAYIPSGKTVGFRLQSRPASGITPQKIRFTYVYWLVEGPPSFGGHGDVPNFGSFESVP